MKNSRFQFLLVAGLLMLLVVLAFLQYRWLGQVSEGERERMQVRLKADTDRFAEDFNREIQNVYFNLQINAADWQSGNFEEFNARYKFWKEKTAYPQLVKEINFVELSDAHPAFQYDLQKGEFTEIKWNDDLEKIKPELINANAFQPVAISINSLLIPVHFDPVASGRNEPMQPIRKLKTLSDAVPDRFGVLIVKLDEAVIKEGLLPDLKKQYFSESDGSNYQISVVNNSNESVYQTEDIVVPDYKTSLFEISPERFVNFTNRRIMTTISSSGSQIVVSDFKNSKIGENAANSNTNVVELRVLTQEVPEPKIRQGSGKTQPVWTLNVRHSAGSLDTFISNTRRKNLAISFGILSILGVAVLLIFASSQRSKMLAQRQLEFVSSVSHEFRTPLAVIYSAGENLADGIAKEEMQISRYGNLIKGEGKKLSAMVEQILDFAGATSGKKKYDLRPQNPTAIIEDALNECQPTLEEKNFVVEKDLDVELPFILGDKIALSHAIQNLIFNSIKYSNGSRYLKIAASAENGEVSITVEDHGMGIDGSDLPHIFEPFYRAKSVVDDQIHGSGLGLSLVKQTIEAHGGTVSVESELGKGTTFILRFGHSV